MTGMDGFVLIVDWLPLLDAMPEYREWLERQGHAESQVDPNAVRVETGRGADGDRRRIWIAREELHRLGIDIA